MPMIDIYAPAGIFPDVHRLATAAVRAIERVLTFRGLTSDPLETLGGETFRMEAKWRAAPESRKGPRLG